ncbi:MAG: hypothetical protein M5R38_18545 [Candidatus Methylomirabilis sp.]|nr:hypothetical protein [Candidatus Methylomirabilis sp.]
MAVQKDSPQRSAHSHQLSESGGLLAAIGRGVVAGITLARRWLSGEVRPVDHDPHLRYHLTIAAQEAAFGVRKRVSFMRGDRLEELMVTIPPGTRSGTRLRLKGKGLEGRDGMRGDLYLHVTVG